MAIFRFDQQAPRVADSAWVADSATVIGDVDLADGASVWYGAVLRGDNDRIRIGRNSNVQDGSVLHTDRGIELVVEDGVTIGHQCMLHGCHIGSGTLVGIQAVILNRARIGRHCLVGAKSLVTEGKAFPDGSMIMGSPAKVVRPLTPEEIARVAASSAHYVQLAQRHHLQTRPVIR